MENEKQIRAIAYFIRYGMIALVAAAYILAQLLLSDGLLPLFVLGIGALAIGLTYLLLSRGENEAFLCCMQNATRKEMTPGKHSAEEITLARQDGRRVGTIFLVLGIAATALAIAALAGIL